MGKVFSDLDRRIAIRKMISFWYDNFFGYCSLFDFVENCKCKRIENVYTIIYEGSDPRE